MDVASMISWETNDEDPRRGDPSSYAYKNRLFTRAAIKHRVLLHAEKYKAFPHLHRQFTHDVASILNEEYPYIREQIRPVYKSNRNNYQTQRNKRGEKRPLNCYILFCKEMKDKHSAAFIQARGLHNLWNALSIYDRDQYREKAKNISMNVDTPVAAQASPILMRAYDGGPKLPASGSAIKFKVDGVVPETQASSSEDEETDSSSSEDEVQQVLRRKAAHKAEIENDSDDSSSDSDEDI